MFALGVGAALIPVICQFVIALIVWLDQNDFPKSDPTIISLPFWDTQMLLVCIAVAANTLVDFFKLVVDKSAKSSFFVVKVCILGALFLILSLCFSVTLLGQDVASKTGFPLLILGVVILILSYMIDMDLALIDVAT